MFEIILAAPMVGTMAKIADADNQSPWLWGGVAILATIAAIALFPIPYLRVVLSFIGTIVAMIVYKMKARS